MAEAARTKKKIEAGLPATLLQAYQIIAQTVLGVLGIGGYMGMMYLVLTHEGEWTPFQQNLISGSISFASGTIVAGVFGYAFGSSFGSMTKTAAMEQRLDQSKKDQSNGEDCVEGEK